MINKFVPAAIAALVATLTGCSTDGLFVGTYTRVGIDASQDGSGGGIGVKNVAMTVAPTKASGEAYSILGTTDVDLSFTELALYEVVATGQAADCASGKGKRVELAKQAEAMLASDPNTPDPKKIPAPLIFVAGTSWSLLEFTLGDASGLGVSFGYRRTVGIRMPIKNETIGSSYASVTINTSDSDHSNGAPKSEFKGTRSKYTFATGAASVNMAKAYAAKLNGEPGNTSITGCPES